MRVSSVDLNACGSCNFQPLVNILSPDEPQTHEDTYGKSPSASDAGTHLFTTINQLNRDAYGPKERFISDPNLVNTWLQYPNDIIRYLAMQLVRSEDSDDVKMEKIQRWVVNSIEYISDEDQYGYEELWVPPVMVLRTQKGDCEDGAFLIMSLGLNAGVDPDRLRMYGGFVDAGAGAASGGHGWVAYRRESDDEWVAVDFSYYPDLGPMAERVPLKDDEKYIDDYFFITNQYIVTTEITNRVRHPEVYYPDGRVTPNIFFPAGTLLSRYA